MYEVYDANRKCVGCFWRSAYEHLVEDDVKRGQYVKIYDTFGELSFIIKNYDELIEYRECVARAATWGKQIAGNVASEVKKNPEMSALDLTLSARYYSRRRKTLLNTRTTNYSAASQRKKQQIMMKPEEVTTIGPFAQAYGAGTITAATVNVGNIGKTSVKQPTPVKDHINPNHYKDFMPNMQWLEAMQYLPRFRDRPDVFAGAVELQIRKYLDRNGGKDEEIQELSKALWYMKFLVAYLKEGKPIKIEAINKILEG